MKTGTLVGLALTMLALPAGPRAWGADADYLGGKGLAAYVQEVRQERATGAPVEIRSKCFNACVLKLAAANVEIAPDALLSAHAGWAGNRPEDLLTPAAYAMVPQCARRVLDRRPLLTDPLWRVWGREILAACPQMHELRQ